MVTTSGATPKCWKPNHLPVRPKPVCTSSTMNSSPRSSHSRRTAWKYSAVGGVHAALALHGFEQHGGDRRVERRLERVDVVPRHVAEALGQRLERLVLLRLAGGVQRGERAPVERAVGAHDDVAAAAAELAGELDARTRWPRRRSCRRRPARRRRAAGRAWRPPRAAARCRRGSTRAAASRLVGDRLGDHRVGVPERRDREPGQEVEVAVAVAVPQARCPRPART